MLSQVNSIFSKTSKIILLTTPYLRIVLVVRSSLRSRCLFSRFHAKSINTIQKDILFCRY